MSQSQNTVPNGPSGEVVDHKNAYEPQVKVPSSGNEHPPQPVYNPHQIDGSPRPQLLRIDSRSGLQPRPGFPNPLLRPSQPRPPPPGGTPFVQRPPLPQRPPGQNIFPQTQTRQLLNPGVNVGVRPGTPFQRPQGPGVRPQVVFQQRPVPVGGPHRPPFNSYQIPRSQTLDSSESTLSQNADGVDSTVSENKNETEKPALAAMKNRSFSVSGGNVEPKPVSTEDRRRSISSVGSIEEEKRVPINIDIVNGKVQSETSSRPESRTDMHMKKIEEDEDDMITSKKLPSNKSSTFVNNSIENLTEKIASNLPSSPTPTATSNQQHRSPTPAEHPMPPLLQQKSPVPPLLQQKSPTPPLLQQKSPTPPLLQQKSPTPPLPQQKSPTPPLPPQKSPTPALPQQKAPTPPLPQQTSATPSLPQQKSPVPPIPQQKAPTPFAEARENKKPPVLGKYEVKEENANIEKPGRKAPDLKTSGSPKLKLSKTEGDNDSGVDESTQGNDPLSNGDQSSPKKSTKSSTPRSSTTPTKNKSFTRGAKSPNPKSPETPTGGTAEKKKVPMNKIQVGSAPSPNLRVVKSKIGSLENASHKPGGGHVKIESRKVDFSTASSRITAKNEAYVPGGGDKKIQQQKLTWSAKSKIGSLENAAHKPKGGDKKIESIKLDFKDKAKPKIGSKDNMKHVPGGGDVKSEPEQEEIKKDIETKKLDIKVQSKIRSLDNIKHKPGGGDKKIFDDKDYIRQVSTHSNASLDGSQKKKARPKNLDINSPEVNLISPTQQKVRILEEVQVREIPSPDSRPSSRLSRPGSARSKRPATPRPPWRY